MYGNGRERTLLEESLPQVVQTLSRASRQRSQLLHDRTDGRRHLDSSDGDGRCV